MIGWHQEIEKLDREDALAFYRRFYAPNNAILVIAGDVDAKDVRPMAEQTFGQVAPHHRHVRRLAVRRAQRQHGTPGHQRHGQAAGIGAHHQQTQRRRGQQQFRLRNRQGAVETHQPILPQPPTAERQTVTRLATDASVKLNTRCG